MADSARPSTPRGLGAPKSPRNNEAAAGAAAARPFVQRLRAAGDDADSILDLVKEAERGLDSLHALSEIYGAAVDIYSKARNTEDYDLSDLSVKRMRVLCRLNPAEAREFHNRLRAYSTTRADARDARMYEARAEMENRLGDTAKAIKMLQEGLRVGAQPEEALRRQLKKLQPAENSGPSAPATPRVGNAAPAGQAAGSVPPSSPHQEIAVAAEPPLPPNPATASTTVAATTLSNRGQGAAPLRPRPRLLGLGPAERVLAGEEGEEEEADEEEAEEGAEDDEEVHSCEEGGEDEEEEDEENSGRPGEISTTMASQCPLSPIQEATPTEEATCETAPRTSDTRASIPPPGSTAPTPRREAIMATPRSAVKEAVAATPRSLQHDLSIDSGTPSVAQPTPSRSSKSILVNGVAYSQMHTIGRGGSSKVYLVQNPAGESMALKRVITDSAKQFEAFQNEVDLLLRLRGQEYIIQVLDAEVDQERGRIHIVMEAADMDLGRYLQTEQRLSLAKVQNIWRQMLAAVQVIHHARIVHSDLKPGNFVLVGGKLKVIDFGIAKRISNDTTNISRDASIGTLSYMAPEAVKNGSLKLGRSSDIWSLGIILYQMVYQHPPFAHLEPMQRLFMLNSPDLKIMFPEGHCLDAHSSTTKAQLVDILEGCLHRDPRRRPSLSALLAHPFLRTTAEVQRGTLESAVTSVMGHVARALGEPAQATDPDEPAADDKWQALADEVWEHVAGTRDASSGEASGFEGLAPVAALATRFSDLQRERDSALEEVRRQEARNAELEEQLRRLQQRGAAQGPSPNNELKERGLKSQWRSEGKENAGAVNTAAANAIKGFTEDNHGLQRLRACR